MRLVTWVKRRKRRRKVLQEYRRDHPHRMVAVWVAQVEGGCGFTRVYQSKRAKLSRSAAR